MEMSFHIISDLNFYPTEDSVVEEDIPDVDVVFMNGNIGIKWEKTLLYASKLCKKHPTTQFVLNLGFGEAYTRGNIPKVKNELRQALLLTSKLNKDWPVNLTYKYAEPLILQLRNGHKIDCLNLFGFPEIHSLSVPWEKTIWYKNIIQYTTNDHHHPEVVLPKDTSDVPHGNFPVWATRKYIKEQYDFEYQIVKKWELNFTNCLKVLITHTHPYDDTRYQGQHITPFNMHLQNGLWICGNKQTDCTFVGARLLSNPGRGLDKRHKIFTMNT